VLANETEELKTLVARYRAASSEKFQLQVSRQRSEQLRVLRDRVGNVRRGAELLKSHRLHFETVRPLAENTLHIIGKLKDEASKPGALGGKDSTPHFSALGKSGIPAVQLIESTLLACWQTHVDERTGKHDIAVLADWEHVPDFRTLARSIRATQTKLLELRSSLPSHEDTFSRLQQLGDDLKEAWKKLENAPANIMKFLRQASRAEGAPLALLDDEVLEWLRERNLESSFKVRTTSRQA